MRKTLSSAFCSRREMEHIALQRGVSGRNEQPMTIMEFMSIIQKSLQRAWYQVKLQISRAVQKRMKISNESRKRDPVHI